MINSFTEQYRFLSNFYPAPVYLDGVCYPSVENAYQAAKTTNTTLRAPFLSCTPGQSKRLGKKLEIRPDWDQIKNIIMYNLVKQKFDTKYLGAALINTYPHELVEGNFWNDTYWGVCRGVGENYLGRILMRIREDLQND